MLPSIDEAIKELETAEKLNPGPWIKHSMNVGLAAGNIAEKIPDMDPTKAYIVGLMHDIGRRVGIVDIPTHVYEGYKYCMGKGWEELNVSVPPVFCGSSSSHKPVIIHIDVKTVFCKKATILS